MNLSLSTIWILAQKELRDALRNRWFLLYTIAFVVLSLAFSYLALASSGRAGAWRRAAIDLYRPSW